MIIRVVIADDHEVIRAGLKTFLQADNIRVVGEASNGREAFSVVQELQPDIVLLDVRMPDGDGLECLARIKLDFPQIKVLMLSSSKNSAYVARAVALWASGYLSKSAGREEILNAVRKVSAGENLWSRAELCRVSRTLASQSRVDIDVPLTKLEREILKQVALGFTNQEIATSFGLGFETVKEHLRDILQKLALDDRTQAAVWAVRKNLA